MHNNSQVIALSLGNLNRISQICDFQFSQICDSAIWAADYYHKFVKKSLFVVCGCMFLVKNINFLVSLNQNIHVYFRTCFKALDIIISLKCSAKGCQHASQFLLWIMNGISVMLINHQGINTMHIPKVDNHAGFHLGGGGGGGEWIAPPCQSLTPLGN